MVHDPARKLLVNEVERLRTEVEALRADARRWDYVRRCLAQVDSMHMGGKHSYRFRPLRGHRGPTIDIAIDKAIIEMDEYSAAKAAGGNDGMS